MQYIIVHDISLNRLKNKCWADGELHWRIVRKKWYPVFDEVGTSTTKGSLTTQRKYRIVVFASVEMKNILGGNFKQVWSNICVNHCQQPFVLYLYLLDLSHETKKKIKSIAGAISKLRKIQSSVLCILSIKCPWEPANHAISTKNAAHKHTMLTASFIMIYFQGYLKSRGASQPPNGVCATKYIRSLSVEK